MHDFFIRVKISHQEQSPHKILESFYKNDQRRHDICFRVHIFEVTFISTYLKVFFYNRKKCLIVMRGYYDVYFPKSLFIAILLLKSTHIKFC